MLIEYILNDKGEIVERDKVKIAIDRLRTFEPPEGYYLAFSGGKDSQCIYHLAKEAGVKFDAHFNLTTVDPPEVIYFIRKNYPDVEEHHPRLTMWELIEKKRMPPTRIMRYCCTELKEGGGAGRHVLTGIRWQESVKRSKRRMTEICMKDKTKIFLHPIIDWDVSDVWEYLNSRNIEHCCLYDEGYKRIGCIGCPMSGTKGMLKDFKRHPKYYDMYLKAFAKTLNAFGDCEDKKHEWKSGKTAEDVMNWWIYSPEKGDADQTTMFE